jgi:hypothetical protein
MVALLLSFAAIALAADTLPASRRFVLLAVLRHAAAVACAFAGKIHAPVDCRLRPVPDENDGVQLSRVFRALACALAVPARRAVRAATWLVYGAIPLSRRAAAICDAVTLRPRAADTS